MPSKLVKLLLFLQLPILISDDAIDLVISGVKSSEADMIVFLGTKHARLIQMLDKESSVFRLPMAAIMANEDVAASNVSLHLDTSIVTIEESGGSDNYILREIYSILKGPKITSIFGNWSKNGGLSVNTANVYERRKNLGGIELRDAILPYTKITKLITDNNGNVVDSGGVFQGPDICP